MSSGWIPKPDKQNQQTRKGDHAGNSNLIRRHVSFVVRIKIGYVCLPSQHAIFVYVLSFCTHDTQKKLLFYQQSQNMHSMPFVSYVTCVVNFTVKDKFPFCFTNSFVDKAYNSWGGLKVTQEKLAKCERERCPTFGLKVGPVHGDRSSPRKLLLILDCDLSRQLKNGFAYMNNPHIAYYYPGCDAIVGRGSLKIRITLQNVKALMGNKTCTFSWEIILKVSED